MGKDFAIVPVDNFKVDVTSNLIESVMNIDKIKISKRNCIAIGTNTNIIFDIEPKIIKGKILNSSNGNEINILQSIIGKMGVNKTYVHFYGQENFFKNSKVKIKEV